MSKKIKDEQKKFLGETLNQYDKALDEAINQLDKKNREQNHKISSLVNSFDNEYLEKDVEDNMTTLENSKDGMVIINEIQGNTEVNYCKDGEKELILNGDIDTQGKSFVTLTEGVDGGLVDVSLEGNTEINLSSTKDPVLVTREFDDINCNAGKLQYTIDDVTIVNDEPGKVDIDRIVGDTMVNHAVNGSEELILNARIDESGDNNITLNGVTSDGGKVDVALEGNTLVNVSNVKDDYITPSIEDKVDQGTVISLPEVSEGYINIDSIEGNTLVNYCTDGAKELTLNGDIDVEGTLVTTTEGVDGGLVDVILEGNTLVNLFDKNIPFTTREHQNIEGINTYRQKEIPMATNGTFHIIAPIGDKSSNSSDARLMIYKYNKTNNTSTLVRDYLGNSNPSLNLVISLTREEVLLFNCWNIVGDNFNKNYPTMMILEGDYTDKEIPQYFEGMKSVGECEELEVISKNRNLYDPNKSNIIRYGYFNSDGTLQPNNSYVYTNEYTDISYLRGKKLYISITKNGVYGSFGYLKFVLYDIYKNVIGFWATNGASESGCNVPTNAKYIRFSFASNSNNLPNATILITEDIDRTYIPHQSNTQQLTHEPLRGLPNGVKDRFVKIGGKWFIERNCGIRTYEEGDKGVYVTDLVNTVHPLETPIYEPLEIEPTLNTYNDVTHISNNSIIPCNMKVKNTGYNAIIKSSTLYTVVVDTNKTGTIGINLAGAEVTTINNVATITTPSILTDDSLRIYGKGIKGSRVRLLEGDKTNWIPEFFEGMKSSFDDRVQDDGLYKMEIMSKDGNLIDIKYQALINKASGMSCDFITYKNLPCWQISSQPYTECYNYFRCKYEQNTQYSLSFDCEMVDYNDDRVGVEISVIYADGTIQIITIIKDTKRVEITTLPDKTVQRIRFQSWGYGGILNMYNMQLIKGDTPKTIMEKSNSIQLSSIEPLRGVGDVHDRLVFKDGKLMIERKCSSVTFDGSDDESWIKQGDDWDTDNRITFKISLPKSNLQWWTLENEISTSQNRMSKKVSSDKFTYIYNIPNENVNDFIGQDEDISMKIPTRQLVIGLSKNKLTTQDVAGFKQWLQQNPTTVVYQLAEPTYEEIPYDLQKIILESYNNGTLFFDTNIPPTKVSFNCFEEELTYLYPSTSYTLQFNSDRTTTADVNLGGTQLLAQSIVKGLNRINITTSETLANNKLVIDGAGAKISEVVVTNTDREFKYFEGMKSVGECEELEVVSRNVNMLDINKLVDENNWLKGLYRSYPIKVKPNTNYTISMTGNKDSGIWLGIFGKPYSYVDLIAYFLWNVDIEENTDYKVTFNTKNRDVIYLSIYGTSAVNAFGADGVLKNVYLSETTLYNGYIPHKSNIQQLTHEPLRSVGDYKDRYVLLDGKWYIERNCGTATVDNLMFGIGGTFSEHNTISFVAYLLRGSRKKDNGKIKCNAIKVSNYSTYREYVDYDYITLWLDSTAFCVGQIRGLSTLDDVRQYFRDNNVVIIYTLATPTYEEIDYNPFDTYADITHISVNSSIPCNIIVKNHGYNTVALKENTQYTLYVDKNTTNALTYRLGDYIEINSQSKFTFTTPSTLTDKTLRIDGKGTKVKDLMLIEGTPTNDSIGYFDGLKSSYECEQVTDELDENYGKYKVDIKVVGKNLFDKSKFINAELCTFNGIECIKVQDTNKYFKYYDNFKYNTQYTLTLKVYREESFIDRYFNVVIEYTDGTEYKVGLKPSQLKTITTDQNKTINYIHGEWMFGGNGYIDLSVAQLEEGDTATEYEPYFESKQTIYLNSPLLKGDEIVWKDNKIQHYHKMGSIVLDGSEDEAYELRNNELENTINFRFTRVNLPANGNNFIIPIYSNNFSTMKYTGNDLISNDVEHLATSFTYFILRINKSKLSTIDATGLKQWLQQNPTTVVYQLAEPVYEEISPYPLKFNTKENCSLTTESNIQVTQISFNIYEETLAYLYPSTKYYVSFNADISREIVVDLGGTKSRFTTQVGYNKIEITTPADTTNMLTFNGQGINIDHVIVTKQDIDEYFEGMKSVGECEDLEVVSSNSDGILSNTQTLTHEPLRAVGDIKDRYVLIDGKWYIERNCAEVVLDGSEDWKLQKTKDNTIAFYTTDIPNKSNFNMYVICDKFITVNNANPMDSYDFDCIKNASGFYINISKSKLSSGNTIGFKQWLQQNPTTVVYQLATPTYEPIDYNPFEVYSDITHISNNSTIPCNMIIKNHGYNCILKPSTTYTIALNKPSGTISAKLGGSAKVDSTNSVFTITTPSTLNDNVLRLSGSGKVKDIMILEGDKTVNTPSYFEGIESVFEQEYDTEKGKYRVTAKVIGKNLLSINKNLKIANPVIISSHEVVNDKLNITNRSYNGWIRIFKMSVDPNKTYSVSYKCESTTDSHRVFTSLNGNRVGDYRKNGSDLVTITGITGVDEIIIQYNTVTEGTAVFSNVQVEEGTEATAYEPYKESSIVFYINEPLRGVENNKDKVFIQDNKVVVQRNCGSYTFDGSDDEEIVSYIDREKTHAFGIKKGTGIASNKQCLSNNFVGYGNSLGVANTKDREDIVVGSSVAPFTIYINKNKLNENTVDGFRQWLQQNPLTVAYQLAEPTYEEADCDLSKLVLENYENSSLIFESNIPVSANIRYSGEVPVVTQAKSLSSQVDNTTLDINENIIPYMCDIDYRIVELQLMNGDTQGEGIELLGIGDIEILGNENVLFNNREDKKYNYSYDMLKRDILSQRYSREEYQYRLDRYLLANKISDEEYKELEGLLNNGE